MCRLVSECQEGENFELLRSLTHPDFRDFTAAGSLPKDKEGIIMSVKQLHAVLKERKIEIIQCIGQGNVVATNKVLRGRLAMDFAGIEATNQMVEFPIMDFVTFEDGMVKSHWARTGQLKQVE